VKRRADELLVASGLVEDLRVARSLIMQGEVLWSPPGSGSEQRIGTAGAQLPEDATFRLKRAPRTHVSRAGDKLAAALEAFEVDVRGRCALDVGISTGGFTDCLLQRGAASVVGVDVAYGFVAERIRTDPRVRLLERTNARHLTPADIGGPVDLLVADLSFISLGPLMPVFRSLVREEAQAVLLVKPQFEAEPSAVDGGIVRDETVQRATVEAVAAAATAHGFDVRGIIPSPVRGARGNQEYLLGLFL
jgi:23S rRNA (cytidine1920-2'-O)/16S rRNA (cytidine1409-2'-O)-methyltransferase